MSVQDLPAIVEALPPSLQPIRRELTTLARAWLDHGATEVTIVRGQDRFILATSDASAASPHPGPSVSAPISCPAAGALLEVAGISSAQSARVRSDANLLGQLATREHELQDMTSSLLAANDQLIAFHELSTTMVGSLDAGAVCCTLAEEAVRLLACAAVAIVSPDTAPVGAGPHGHRQFLIDVADSCDLGDGEVFRSAASPERATIVVAAGQHGETRLAVLGHPGQTFDGAAIDLLDAIALKLGHQLDLATRHRDEVTNDKADRDGEITEALFGLLWDRLPEPLGASVAGSATHGVLNGVLDGRTARYFLGTASRTGVGSALFNAAMALSATAGLADPTVTDPAAALELIAQEVERKQTRTHANPESLADPATPRMPAIMSCIEWDDRSGRLRLAATSCMTLVVRAAGRATVLEPIEAADETGMVELSLDHGDAILIASPVLLDQPDPTGRPLGVGALLSVMADRSSSPARDLVAQVCAVAGRHRGDAVAHPGQAFLVLVRSPHC